MVAPEVRREEPATRLAEREMLEAWLDYHRATLLRKCAGLDADQLKVASCPPSSLSLLGLVRHMADIEKGWFADFAGQGWEPRYRSPEDPRGEFESLNDDPVADVFTTTRSPGSRWSAADRTACSCSWGVVSIPGIGR